MPRILLASTSPRRLAMLEGAGFQVRVVPPAVDESALLGEEAAALVVRLARSKAESVAADADEIVVAGDTVVLLDGEVLGKPRDADDAMRMLRSLSGRAHEVIGGWCVRRGGDVISGVARTTVRFRTLTDLEIGDYVATGEPFDKAGAYGIQERGGALVASIEGSFANVVGLPLDEVVQAMGRLRG